MKMRLCLRVIEIGKGGVYATIIHVMAQIQRDAVESMTMETNARGRFAVPSSIMKDVIVAM